MKKLLLITFALMMLLMAGCTKKEDPAGTEDLVLIKIETEGIGQIAVAKEGEELKFDEQYPTTSAYMNVDKGTVVSMAAKPQVDDYMFVKWTKDGADYSTEDQITVTVDAPMDFKAVFALSNGWDGPAASSIEEVKKVGDVLALPNFGYSIYEEKYVTAVELNGTVYRIIADLEPDTAKALFDLEFDDPEHDKKMNELLVPLEVTKIENVNEAIPSKEEVDKYIGKSGADLLEEGWSWNFYNLDDMEFGFDHGWFAYNVKFDGKIENKEDLDIEEAIKDLKVIYISYEGIGAGVTDVE